VWNDLLAALSLVLVIEGLMPFLSPQRSRETLKMIVQMEDRALRTLGLVSMISGVVMLYLVR
jgi:uncharacterized protein YjeT (DUF2065 family)